MNRWKAPCHTFQKIYNVIQLRITPSMRVQTHQQSENLSVMTFELPSDRGRYKRSCFTYKGGSPTCQCVKNFNKVDKLSTFSEITDLIAVKKESGMILFFFQRSFPFQLLRRLLTDHPCLLPSEVTGNF